MDSFVKVICDISGSDTVVHQDGMVSCPYIVDDSFYISCLCSKQEIRKTISFYEKDKNDDRNIFLSIINPKFIKIEKQINTLNKCGMVKKKSSNYIYYD